MLPDYLRVKKRLHELYMERWYRLAASDGVLGNLPEPQTLHEGNRHHLVREDGSEQDVTMKQSSASLSFHFDELDTATTEEIIKKWDAAAKDMHGQMIEFAKEWVTMPFSVGFTALAVSGDPITAGLATAGTIAVQVWEKVRQGHVPDKMDQTMKMMADLWDDLDGRSKVQRLLSTGVPKTPRKEGH